MSDKDIAKVKNILKLLKEEKDKCLLIMDDKNKPGIEKQKASSALGAYSYCSTLLKYHLEVF